MKTRISNTLDLGRWCILIVTAPNTLRLAASLTEDGFEAWAPTETVMRQPKSGTKPEPVVLPLIPGFVFVRADRLDDLLALSRSPAMLYQVWDAELRKMVAKGHPYFRVMPCLEQQGGWATVRDDHLVALRLIERKRKPRGAVKTIPIGTKVRLHEGGFAGLDGIVQSVRKKFAMVLFDRFPVPVQIGCWLLTEALDAQASVKVNGQVTEQAMLAKAA